MQTKRFLVGFGVVAVALTSALPSQAGPDNDAQAKMRDALRQKMEALNAPAAPAPAPAPAAKVETVKPAVTAPAAVTPTVVVPVPVEAVAPAAPAPVAKSGSSKFSEVPGANDDATEAKMREALRQKIAAEPAAAPAAATTAAVVAPAKPAAPAKPVAPAVAPAPAPAATSVVASPTPEPVVAPAFSGSKQDRLSALLQQYRADQITPQQYHTQRAKIIAEP